MPFRFSSTLLVLAGLLTSVAGRAQDCEGAVATPSNQAKVGAYYPMTGSPERDYAGIFVGPRSWARTRQWALMEESFLHELKIDHLIDQLTASVKNSSTSHMIAHDGYRISPTEDGLRFVSGATILHLRLVRSTMDHEPLRIEFQYQVGEAPAYEAQYIFPMDYRRPSVDSSARNLRRRRLIWGIKDRFQGSWSSDLYEFLLGGILAMDVVDSSMKALVQEQQKLPRLAWEAARTYYRGYYPSAVSPQPQ